MFGRRYFSGSYFAPRYFGDGDDTLAPPSFSGTIADISVTENTGTHSYDLSTYFTGATSYSIAPAVETGWTFDTVTGELEIDTDAVGVFGPFVVTGTNLAGSDDSNAFSVTVTAVAVTDQPSGGWLFLNQYESELQRRRARQRLRKRLEEETEQIENAVEREIAQIFREDERAEDEADERERVLALAKANADIEAARKYSAAVAQAYQVALETGARTAIAELEQALRLAREDEEFLMLSILLMDHG